MPAQTAIVFVNTGSPDAPTEAALRVYLKEFLSDPRIIEMPRWVWLPILNLFILPSRSAKSADRYAKIWTDEGSPLIKYTQRVVTALSERCVGRDDVRIEMAMRVGNPSIQSVVERLIDDGVERIHFVPMFAQYATQTTESILDAVKATMLQFGSRAPQWTSEPAYYLNPLYIDALKTVIERNRADDTRHLVMSFHGIPAKCSERGDPYEKHCEATAKALAQALGLTSDQWSIAYQSRFGTDKWLQPYLPAHVEALAKNGVKAIDVVCLSFAVDCLETLEEIAIDVRDHFLRKGGESYGYLPCLNDEPKAIDLYESLICKQLEK